MAKSKQRKNHKKKLQQRKTRQQEHNQKVKKLQKQLMDQFALQQEIAKREHIVETIYRNKPEIGVLTTKTNEETGDTYEELGINYDILEYQNDMLVWKENGNPLLAGLEPLENYPIYTDEIVNQFLRNIQYRDDLKQQEIDKTGMTAEVVDNVEDELGLSDDFELIEDDDFIQEAEVEIVEPDEKN